MDYATADIYCAATRGRDDEPCGNYVPADSRLCNGCRSQLLGHLVAVPALIGWVRQNRRPGTGGKAEPITGTRESRTPVSLASLDDADSLYALVHRYAEWIADTRRSPNGVYSTMPAWRNGGVVLGLRVNQGIEAALRCSKDVTTHFEFAITQEWAGVMGDEFRQIVGPIRSRWAMDEKPRWMVCPKCDNYTMTRFGPTFTGGPITHTCTTVGCEANLTEDDFGKAVWERKHRHDQDLKREKETA